MDDNDISLLMAVDQGDIASMGTCLSSMSDPTVCLNRIYEVNGEKRTLLMMACLMGYESMISMLLKCFKPDLEVLNTIQIKKKRNVTTYEDVTVLCTAVLINNFLIVKQFVEHGACINHTTRNKSTPVHYACYNGNYVMVRYLVENGANIEITRDNYDTNLVMSVRRKHFNVTAYLVDELGCDVNECDSAGRSLLYFAVECQSFKLVQFLLHHGVRNSSPINGYMSPLMLAAETRCSNLVDEISIYCPLIEWIEAEELLGSSFACIENGSCHLRQSFEHYYRALQLRSLHNLPKVLKQSAIQMFKDQRECQTIDQLEELRFNHERMYIEAILVRERLLGPTSEKYRASLVYRGVTLAYDKQFHQTVALWLHELNLCQQYSIRISRPVIEKMKDNETAIDYHLYTLVFLITVLSQPSVSVLISDADRRSIYRHLKTISQNQYVSRNSGSSLLHLCFNDSTSILDEFVDSSFRYPSLSTARTLLQYGTDVNIVDAIGNTPLHILAANSKVYDENALRFLCDAGAHLDYTNALRETPIDVASNIETKQLLRSKMKISLKCLCARLIQKSPILFEGKLSESLVIFVKRY